MRNEFYLFYARVDWRQLVTRGLTPRGVISSTRAFQTGLWVGRMGAEPTELCWLLLSQSSSALFIHTESFSRRFSVEKELSTKDRSGAGLPGFVAGPCYSSDVWHRARPFIALGLCFPISKPQIISITLVTNNVNNKLHGIVGGNICQALTKVPNT